MFTTFTAQFVNHFPSRQTRWKAGLLRTLRCPLYLFVGILLGMLFILGHPVLAQPSKSPVLKSKTGFPVEAPSTDRIKQRDIIYLPNQSGKLVPVPVDGNWEGYQKWLKESSTINPKAGSQYSFSAVSLQGKIIEGVDGEEYADLMAELRIQINVEGWVRVPLKLNGAILQGKPIYEGKGKATYDANNKKAGFAWWIRGKGIHKLKLPIAVSIRKQLQTRRLLLDVPKGLVSEVRLTVPQKGVVVKPNPRYLIHPVAAQEKSSLIRAVGFEERLDLSWTPNVVDKSVKTVLSSVSEVLISNSEDFISYYAEQRIDVKQGSFSSLEVKLPSMFEFSRVEAKNMSTRLQTAKKGSWVTLQFDNRVSDQTVIKWIFRAPRTAVRSQKIVLDGLQVKGAISEIGDIALAKSNTLRFVPTRFKKQTVIPVTMESISLPGTFTGAFRFLSQPYSLNLDVIPITPIVRVVPDVHLQMGGQQMKMNLKLKVEVIRGSVNDLEIDWQELVLSQWKFDDISSDLVESTTWQTVGVPRMKIQFHQAMQDTFEIEISGRRDVPTKKQSFTIPIPRPRVADVVPANLFVEDLESVESTFTAKKPTVLKKVNLSPGAIQSTKGLPEKPYDGLQRKQYRVSGIRWVLNGRVRTYTREIQAKNAIQLETRNDTLSLRQSFLIDVYHEPLDQFSFRVSSPEEIQFRCYQVISAKPTDGSQEKLGFKQDVKQGSKRGITSTVSRIAERKASPYTGYTVTLSEKISGSIVIEAIRTYPTSDFSSTVSNGSQPQKLATLSLIQFLNKEIDENILEIMPSAVQQIQLIETEWKSLLTKSPSQNDERERYQRFGRVDSLQFKIMNLPHTNGLEYRISSALIHYRATEQNRQQGTIQFFLQSAPSQVVLFLPKELKQISSVYWNGSPVPSTIAADAKGERFVSITLPSMNNVLPAVLEISFTCETASSFLGVRHWELPIPHFDEGVWIEQTLWIVDLPKSDYLFSTPQGVRPGYTWHFHGWGWSRSQEDFVTEFQDAFPQVSSQSGLFKNLEHSYAFFQSGTSQQLEIRGVGQSTLFLFGSGFILAIVVLMYKKRVRIHLGTVIILGVIGWTLLLAYPEQLMLFAQPVVMGLILAAIAIGIDRTVKERTLESPDILFGTTEYHPDLSPSSIQSQSNPIFVNPIQSHEQMTELHNPDQRGFSPSDYGSTAIRSGSLDFSQQGPSTPTLPDSQVTQGGD